MIILSLHLSKTADLPLPSGGIVHITAIAPRNRVEEPGNTLVSLKDALGLRASEAVLPKLLEFELWRACRRAGLDVAAAPGNGSVEADLRVFLDAVLIAIATYISDCCEKQRRRPSLVLEAEGGAVDYLCSIAAFCLEAKRPGGLKDLYVDACQSRKRKYQRKQSDVAGICTSPHLQTLAAMLNTGCMCGATVDDKRLIFHAMRDDRCFVIAMTSSNFFPGLRRLASISDPFLAIATMDPDLRSSFCILQSYSRCKRKCWRRQLD